MLSIDTDLKRGTYVGMCVCVCVCCVLLISMYVCAYVFAVRMAAYKELLVCACAQTGREVL